MAGCGMWRLTPVPDLPPQSGDEAREVAWPRLEEGAKPPLAPLCALAPLRPPGFPARSGASGLRRSTGLVLALSFQL